MGCAAPEASSALLQAASTETKAPFVISRLCPVCDRPGPVLEPEVKRAPSVEMRGCAEEVRRVLAQDFGE